jgi:hypothetical protein
MACHDVQFGGYRRGVVDVAETSVIVDASRRAGGWGAIVLGTIFGGFGAVFVAVGATFMLMDGLPPVALFVLVLPALFAAGGTLAVIRGIRNVWLSHVLGAPTLEVPRDQPLYLGGAMAAQFHRSGGTRRAHRSPRLTADLVCDEQVTYRQGTDNHTVTEEVYRTELTVHHDPESNTAAGRIEIEVPVDVAPSLDLRHNKIIWSVRVRVQVPGVPEDTGKFPVTILPAIDARLGARRPDDRKRGDREPGAPR